jgi:RHS repeat-associated protein
VLLTTTYATAAVRGLNEPDSFGNYRTVAGTYYGTRPDTLGLTGKFLDTDIGLYYFGARWFDPERGHWMSEEPLGLDGPNRYQFCFNNPANGCDPTGLWFWEHPFYYNLRCVNNFVGGMGDKLTFGGTQWLRQNAVAGGDTVNYCSSGYTSGELSGRLVRDTLIGAGIGKGISAASSFYTASAAESASTGGRIASLWDTSITNSGSVTNVATDLTTAEFQANLQASGYNIVSSGISRNGVYTVLQDGLKKYTLYTSTSGGLPSAVLNIAKQTLVKIRLLP